MPNAINLSDKLATFSDPYSPRIIAALNDYHFKLAKLSGPFVWHSHPETDEAFLVLEGRLRIDLPEGEHVIIEKGELYVVPKGVQHCPVADQECHVLLIEPAGTENRGDADGGTRGTWI